MRRCRLLIQWLVCLLPAGWIAGELSAQPYVDPLQVRYLQGIRSNTPAAASFSHLWMGSDLPLRLGDNRYLLISPFYEQWQFDSADVQLPWTRLQSIALPLGLIQPIAHGGWSLTAMPIIRWNGSELFGKNTLQFGGVVLAGLALKPNRQIRVGAYANAEFFGFFIVPLLGIDWRADEKNYVFGVLPGRLTYEHKWGERWYGGMTFRAPTNSFRLPDGRFLRVDDNQLSMFLDYYVTPRFCLTLEPGYGLFRRLRLGREGRDYHRKADWTDGWFVKLNGAYRVRL